MASSRGRTICLWVGRHMVSCGDVMTNALIDLCTITCKTGTTCNSCKHLNHNTVLFRIRSIIRLLMSMYCKCSHGHPCFIIILVLYVMKQLILMSTDEGQDCCLITAGGSMSLCTCLSSCIQYFSFYYITLCVYVCITWVVTDIW